MGEGMIMVEVEDGKGFICHEECSEMYSEFDDTGDDVAKQIDDEIKRLENLWGQ